MRAKLAIVFLAMTMLMGTISSQKYGAAWDYLHVALISAATAARTPVFALFKDDGAGSQGVYAFQFDDEAVNEEQVFFSIIGPRWWAEGTIAYPTAYITPEDATVCNYRIGIEFVIASPGGTYAATTVTVYKTFASAADGDALQLVTFDAFDFAGVAMDADGKGRFFRNSADALDTCNGKYLWVHSVGLVVKKDRPGSRTATTK